MSGAHAVRACYAALRMQESVKRYAEGVRRTEGIPIQIRVGLNSGEVVVRSIGSDLKMDYTAVGQTTHLAARMIRLRRCIIRFGNVRNLDGLDGAAGLYLRDRMVQGTEPESMHWKKGRHIIYLR